MNKLALAQIANFSRCPPNCSVCPFGKLLTKKRYYQCGLLRKEEVTRRNDDDEMFVFQTSLVWHDLPVCTLRDWQQRARQELRTPLGDDQ